MHDTCGQRYLIDCRANTQRKKKSVGALAACHAAEISLEYFQIKGVKGEKVKKKTNLLTVRTVPFDELYTNLIFALQVATRC